MSAQSKKYKYGKKDKFIKFFKLDKHETLKHALFDAMKVRGVDTNLSKKLAIQGYKIAKLRKFPVLGGNETSLFQEKEELKLSNKKLLT